MTTWGDVEVGDLIKGKQDQPWQVTRIIELRKDKKRKVTIVNQTEPDKDWTGEVGLDAAIVILEKGAPAIPQVDPNELAVTVVQSVVGGERISERHGADPILHCPKYYEHVGTLLAHLYVHHGHRDLPTRREDADSLHVHDGGVGYIDHTHDLETA